MTLVLPSLKAIPSPPVPVIVPALLMATPVSALSPVLPLIIPEALLVIFTAEEFSLTKIPFSKAVILPLLLISPCMDSILTAVPVVEVIVAPSSLFTSTCCAPVLISSPFPVPEIFPWLVALVTVKPDTVTAASLPAEEIVTSLLITYSASSEKVCGTDVDCSIVAENATAGVHINKAGNSFPRLWVVLFNVKNLLLMYTSI
ncbi:MULTISPECIES: hypothetical protein [Enterobacter cloacae complex]|uniref:hypothetical protein n=1 Tax=Enterobacter cloacae complex TaxID=354276 RepID=UPI001FD81D0A|nr:MULTISPECIES: hypothetical protein [Enterobacter cloacae complex]MDE4080660.1 hypothetical protein [Enterobacter pasteurii]